MRRITKSRRRQDGQGMHLAWEKREYVQGCGRKARRKETTMKT
jgi:hypothetical protein